MSHYTLVRAVMGCQDYEVQLVIEETLVHLVIRELMEEMEKMVLKLVICCCHYNQYHLLLGTSRLARKYWTTRSTRRKSTVYY